MGDRLTALVGTRNQICYRLHVQYMYTVYIYICVCIHDPGAADPPSPPMVPPLFRMAVVVVMVSSNPLWCGCGAGNGGGNGYQLQGHVEAIPPVVLWPVVRVVGQGS